MRKPHDIDELGQVNKENLDHRKTKTKMEKLGGAQTETTKWKSV